MCSRAFAENQAVAVVDPWQLQLTDRWRLYNYWVQKFSSRVRDQLTALQEKYKQAIRRLQEVRSVEHQHVFKEALVIGKFFVPI